MINAKYSCKHFHWGCWSSFPLRKKKKEKVQSDPKVELFFIENEMRKTFLSTQEKGTNLKTS